MRNIKVLITFLSLNLLFLLSAHAQEKRTVVIKDESGNHVPGASVIIGEDNKPVITNERGEFDLIATSNVSILVESEGFDPQIVKFTPSVGLSNITMVKMPYHMSSQDQVDIPFGVLTKRRMTGAITTLKPKDILLYDRVGSVNELIDGRVPGLFGSTNVRGIGSPMYVVDGIARPIASIMNINDIEQISILKDMSTAMLYGPQATNGVVFITTKRGDAMKKSLRFTGERGYNKPISYPNYLSAPDYMNLYNEALYNDGLSPKYTQDQIDSTSGGLGNVRYPDEDYYNSTYLNNWSTYHRVNAEVSGGNDVAQFFLNVGWNRSNGLIKIGEGANEKSDLMNMRGNINYDITDKIRLIYDGSVIFNITNGPRYTTSTQDFWYMSSNFKPDYYPVLYPLSLLDDPQLSRVAKTVGGDNILGGTSEYQTNVYGELAKNGKRGSTARLLEMTTGLEFDLSTIAQGLKAKVYMSFDMYNQYFEEIQNSYAVYAPVWNNDADTIVSWTKYKSDVKNPQKTLSDAYFYRRYGVFGTLDYNKVIGDHSINAVALAYRDEYAVESTLQHTKHLHFGGRANYMFKNKYIAEFTGVYAGSLKLYEADKWAFSPGVGLGWILSEEPFLQNITVLDYLKLRASWAINHTDESVTYKLGRDYYTGGSTFYFNQQNNNNAGRNIVAGNPNLTWESIMNYSMGIEALLLDSKLGLEASYFSNKYYDVITRRTNSLASGYFGANLPYENYGSYLTRGLELGANFNAAIGDLEVGIGGNFVYSVPKTLEIDELNYEESYRKVTGKASDGIFGLVADGLFRDQADIENSVVQTFGPYQPGDIKYKDMNLDGQIDDEDVTMIGNSRARTQLGINVRLRYKAFDLFALATGQNGQERYFNNAYYWIYGDRKYSEVALDRWTPETAETATYPRLSSTSNSNNFRNSTFWLEENNWFDLQTAQLTYTLDPRNFAGLEECRFFLRSNSLMRISKIKEKTQLNVGTAPQMRSYSVGLSLLF